KIAMRIAPPHREGLLRSGACVAAPPRPPPRDTPGRAGVSSTGSGRLAARRGRPYHPPAYASNDAASRAVGWRGTPRVGSTPTGVRMGSGWLAQPHGWCAMPEREDQRRGQRVAVPDMGLCAAWQRATAVARSRLSLLGPWSAAHADAP